MLTPGLMRTLFLIFWVISISFFANADLGDKSQISPAQLVNGQAQVLVTFEEELLKEEEREWLVLTPDLKRQCHLYIHSHFDEDLARTVKTAAYTIYNPQFSSRIMFTKNTYRESFSFQMTTENKNLPLMQFECDIESTDKSNIRQFTLENIEDFIGQKNFFYKIVTEPLADPKALQVMPKPFAVETLIDLNFSQTVEGNRVFPNYPNFTDGKLLKEGEDGICRVIHQELYGQDNATRFVAAGTKYTTHSLMVAYGDFTLALTQGSYAEITIRCSFYSFKPEQRTIQQLQMQTADGFKFTELQ